MNSDTADTVVVVGGGPAGMMAAIAAARAGQRVVLCEGQTRLGLKLLASGGGRCNLTNTLPAEEFMARCGRHGRFMAPALAHFGADRLRGFLAELGVETHAPDARRVFPVSHQSTTVHAALVGELARLGVEIRLGELVTELLPEGEMLGGVATSRGRLAAGRVILATGGRGYPPLGGGQTGYDLARQAGHRVTQTFPAIVPLVVEESWPGECRADTIPGATLEIRGRGRRGVRARGDLIFTERGLAGPLILDAAREITPLLAGGEPVRAMLQLTDADEEGWNARLAAPEGREPVRRWLAQWVPASLADVFCRLAGVEPDRETPALGQRDRHRLAAVLAQTPVTIVASEGWDKAMVTRGGVSLKEVLPDTLASRVMPGLFLAGEALDLDGPCGGFNLQWAFASGALAGAAAHAPRCSASPTGSEELA